MAVCGILGSALVLIAPLYLSAALRSSGFQWSGLENTGWLTALIACICFVTTDNYIFPGTEEGRSAWEYLIRSQRDLMYCSVYRDCSSITTAAIVPVILTYFCTSLLPNSTLTQLAESTYEAQCRHYDIFDVYEIARGYNSKRAHT